MKAKFGAIVTEGRGKAGGHVFTRNRQGMAMRTKVTPINRATTSQQAIKNRLSNVSDDWRTLTDAQRAAWESAASDAKRTNIFGDQYTSTGKNYYAYINGNLLIAGQAVVSSPPANTPATALTSVSLASNTTAAQTVGYAPTPVTAGHTLVIEATRPLSAGVGFAKNQFRILTTVAAAAASPADTFTAYQTKFGTPVAGKRIFVRAYTINNTSGNRSLPLQTSGVTA